MTRFLSSAGTLLLASHSDELLRRFCRRGLARQRPSRVFGAIGECIGFLPPQSCPRVYWQAGFMTQVSYPLSLTPALLCALRSRKHGECVGPGGLLPQLVPRAFCAHFFGSFWLGLSNLLSIAALALVYGTVFKVQDFNTYVSPRGWLSGLEWY